MDVVGSSHVEDGLDTAETWENGKVGIPQKDGEDSHSFPKATKFPQIQNLPTVTKRQPGGLWE